MKAWIGKDTALMITARDCFFAAIVWLGLVSSSLHHFTQCWLQLLIFVLFLFCFVLFCFGQALASADLYSVEFLLLASCNVDEKDSEGWTPLHFAAHMNNIR